MKKLSLIFALLIFIPAILFAQIPRQMSYQCRLLDVKNNPINGQLTITFSLYEQQNGGSAIWNETQTTVEENGFINVYLGTNQPLNIDFDKPLWLQITTNGNDFPRTQLVSSPYAMEVPGKWSHKGDNLTGSEAIGSINNQPLIFKTNNTERMRLSENGNLGIGTNNPTEALELEGNIRFSGALMPNGSAGTSGQVLISQGLGSPPQWAAYSGLESDPIWTSNKG